MVIPGLDLLVMVVVGLGFVARPSFAIPGVGEDFTSAVSDVSAIPGVSSVSAPGSSAGSSSSSRGAFAIRSSMI